CARRRDAGEDRGHARRDPRGGGVNTLHLDTGREWRGGQRQALLLMQGLQRRGHHVRLLAPDAPLLARARTAGVDVEVWRPRGEWDPFAAAGAARAIAAGGAEMVHAHSAHAHPPGAIAAWRTHAPFVVSRRVDFAVATHPLSRLKYRMPVDRYL